MASSPPVTTPTCSYTASYIIILFFVAATIAFAVAFGVYYSKYKNCPITTCPPPPTCQANEKECPASPNCPQCPGCATTTSTTCPTTTHETSGTGGCPAGSYPSADGAMCCNDACTLCNMNCDSQHPDPACCVTDAVKQRPCTNFTPPCYLKSDTHSSSTSSSGYWPY
jgi:hypothetical protein